MRRRVFFTLLLVGCHHKASPVPASTTTASSSPLPFADAAAPVDAGIAAAPCAAIEMRPLATCGTNVVKMPPPEIVDAANALGPFYEKLAELERGNAPRIVRIAMYGDSNMTSDFMSGHIRHVLQTRYGDAGHGWISLSRPWGSYRHQDVVMAGFWPMFKLYAPTTHLVHDKEYGFANMAAQSAETGAAAWAATDPKADYDKAVTHFDFHYFKQKGGGSIRILIDKKELKTIPTKADAWEAGFEGVDVDEGPHEFRAEVRGDGPVRWTGVSLDHAGPAGHPGVQVDSLGAGALNYERLTWVADDTRAPQLQRRDYDLVIVWLGMNVMFVPPNKEYAKTFLASLRAAVPDVPILLLGPSDTVKEGQTTSDKRIVSVAKQMREVAEESKVAFWDFREAMGGDGSVVGFTKRGLTGQDHIHFGPEGGKLMGDRLLCSMTGSAAAYVQGHPDAGCHPKPLTQRDK